VIPLESRRWALIFITVAIAMFLARS